MITGMSSTCNNWNSKLIMLIISTKLHAICAMHHRTLIPRNEPKHTPNYKFKKNILAKPQLKHFINLRYPHVNTYADIDDLFRPFKIP
jgi:hypothetical protein